MDSSKTGTVTENFPVAKQSVELKQQARKAYWRANIRLVGLLMLIWALLSLGTGILFSGWLDNWNVPATAMPLGFFMAQQGAIYGFLLLIAIYVWRMNLLEKKFRQQLAQIEEQNLSHDQEEVQASEN